MAIVLCGMSRSRTSLPPFLELSYNSNEIGSGLYIATVVRATLEFVLVDTCNCCHVLCSLVVGMTHLLYTKIGFWSDGADLRPHSLYT